MGGDRCCAFPEPGAFVSDNWACATMDPIRWAIEDDREWDEDGEGSEWIWRRHSTRPLPAYPDRDLYLAYERAYPTLGVTFGVTAAGFEALRGSSGRFQAPSGGEG